MRGATVAHVAYHGYKTMEEEVIHELTDRARQHFSTRKIDAFGFLRSQLRVLFLREGLVSENKAITFEINAKTLEVFEKNEKNSVRKLSIHLEIKGECRMIIPENIENLAELVKGPEKTVFFFTAGWCERL